MSLVIDTIELTRGLRILGERMQNGFRQRGCYDPFFEEGLMWFLVAKKFCPEFINEILPAHEYVDGKFYPIP